jgi:hypothetical protein
MTFNSLLSKQVVKAQRFDFLRQNPSKLKPNIFHQTSILMHYLAKDIDNIRKEAVKA